MFCCKKERKKKKKNPDVLFSIISSQRATRPMKQTNLIMGTDNPRLQSVIWLWPSATRNEFFLISSPSVPSPSYKGTQGGRKHTALQHQGSGQRPEQAAVTGLFLLHLCQGYPSDLPCCWERKLHRDPCSRQWWCFPVNTGPGEGCPWIQQCPKSIS